MSLELLKLRLQKLGIAIFFPKCWVALVHGVAPSVEHLAVLRKLDIDGIIDVGANRGQFSLACRICTPGLPIAAFEPIPAEARLYRKIHGKAPNIRLFETALGEQAGKATLHLSQSADSSSLLPIGRRQTDLFPATLEVGTIDVAVSRLDDFLQTWSGKQNLLLKIDVQGFELNVLRGGVSTLTQCKYVYVECSEVPLYDGQALRSEVEELLSASGFERKGRFNEQFDSDTLIQADYLFQRR